MGSVPYKIWFCLRIVTVTSTFILYQRFCLKNVFALRKKKTNISTNTFLQDTQPAEYGDMYTNNCLGAVLHFRRDLMAASYVMTSFGGNGGHVTSQEARVQRIDSTGSHTAVRR